MEAEWLEQHEIIGKQGLVEEKGEESLNGSHTVFIINMCLLLIISTECLFLEKKHGEGSFVIQLQQEVKSILGWKFRRRKGFNGINFLFMEIPLFAAVLIICNRDLI